MENKNWKDFDLSNLFFTETKEQKHERIKDKYKEYYSDPFYKELIDDEKDYYHQLDISKLENPKPYKKEKITPYYYCERCEHGNLGKQSCPCPRGSCEASIVGKLVKTTEIIFN